ncbi:MAG: DUF6491 family protein [Xanthomonadales bacterium]
MNRPRAASRLAFALMTPLALIVLAACSTTSYQPMPQEMTRALTAVTGQDGRECMRVNDIAGYGTLNDSVLSVSSKFRNHYLLVALYRCPEMETSSAALFKGSFTEFCGGGRDSVLAGKRRCPIQGVFEFENREAAFAAYDQAVERIRASRDAETP